jgi:hypothetical protein
MTRTGEELLQAGIRAFAACGITREPTKTVEELLKPEPFIVWLAAQPPEKTYNYDSSLGCPIAKYLEENGHTAAVFPDKVWANGWHSLPHEMDAIVRYNHDELGSRTYGGALNAAREWQKALATT